MTPPETNPNRNGSTSQHPTPMQFGVGGPVFKASGRGIVRSQRGVTADNGSDVTYAGGTPVGSSIRQLKILPSGEAIRFPKLEECAHFHYDFVDVGIVRLKLLPLGDTRSLERGQFNASGQIPTILSDITNESPPSKNRASVPIEGLSFSIEVMAKDNSWIIKRTYEQFRQMDHTLHLCIYDRRFSLLFEIPPLERAVKSALSRKGNPLQELWSDLRNYVGRLSTIAGNLINCGPILNWLELDNRGNHLLAAPNCSGSAPINTPAVAAAHVIKSYAPQAPDELRLEVGDIVSVIDMPPAEDTTWWRGKKGFGVGFFPSEHVQVIGEQVEASALAAQLAQPNGSSASGKDSCVVPMETTPGFSTPTLSTSNAATPTNDGDSAVSMTTKKTPKPVLRRRGKLISRLRSLLLTRPASKTRLRQSGIMKERVFGCDLGENLLNTGRPIPFVLQACAGVVEEHGIVDGVYRLSGVASSIHRLRALFDNDGCAPDVAAATGTNVQNGMPPSQFSLGTNDAFDLAADETVQNDIHAIGSLLKMYFRELPNPLLTYQLYDKFVEAVSVSEEGRLNRLRDCVERLPPPHFRTVCFLMRHLSKMADHSHLTNMHARNLAIVWAPNLLRSKSLELRPTTGADGSTLSWSDVTASAALHSVGIQAVVIEYLIRYADSIFTPIEINDITMGRDMPPLNAGTGSTTPRRSSRPKSLAVSTPTRLLSLEEARLRANPGGVDASSASETSPPAISGPGMTPGSLSMDLAPSLTKEFHTIIAEHPGGKKAKKEEGGKNDDQGETKTASGGWRSLFTRGAPDSRKSSRTSVDDEDAEVAGAVSVTQRNRADKKRSGRLRSVKSAESLSSNHHLTLEATVIDVDHETGSIASSVSASSVGKGKENKTPGASGHRPKSADGRVTVLVPPPPPPPQVRPPDWPKTDVAARDAGRDVMTTSTSSSFSSFGGAGIEKDAAGGASTSIRKSPSFKERLVRALSPKSLRRKACEDESSDGGDCGLDHVVITPIPLEGSPGVVRRRTSSGGAKTKGKSLRSKTEDSQSAKSEMPTEKDRWNRAPVEGKTAGHEISYGPSPKKRVIPGHSSPHRPPSALSKLSQGVASPATSHAGSPRRLVASPLARPSSGVDSVKAAQSLVASELDHQTKGDTESHLANREDGFASTPDSVMMSSGCSSSSDMLLDVLDAGDAAAAAASGVEKSGALSPMQISSEEELETPKPQGNPVPKERCLPSLTDSPEAGMTSSAPVPTPRSNAPRPLPRKSLEPELEKNSRGGEADVRSQSPPRPASLEFVTEVVAPKTDVEVAHSRLVHWPQRQTSQNVTEAQPSDLESFEVLRVAEPTSRRLRESFVDDVSSGADTPSDDLHRLSDLDGLDQSFRAETPDEGWTKDWKGFSCTDSNPKSSRRKESIESKRFRRKDWKEPAKHSAKELNVDSSKNLRDEDLRLIESFLETSVEDIGDPEAALKEVLEDGAKALTKKLDADDSLSIAIDELERADDPRFASVPIESAPREVRPPPVGEETKKSGDADDETADAETGEEKSKSKSNRNKNALPKRSASTQWAPEEAARCRARRNVISAPDGSGCSVARAKSKSGYQSGDESRHKRTPSGQSGKSDGSSCDTPYSRPASVHGTHGSHAGPPSVPHPSLHPSIVMDNQGQCYGQPHGIYGYPFETQPAQPAYDPTTGAVYYPEHASMFQTGWSSIAPAPVTMDPSSSSSSSSCYPYPPNPRQFPPHHDYYNPSGHVHPSQQMPTPCTDACCFYQTQFAAPQFYGNVDQGGQFPVGLPSSVTRRSRSRSLDKRESRAKSDIYSDRPTDNRPFAADNHHKCGAARHSHPQPEERHGFGPTDKCRHHHNNHHHHHRDAGSDIGMNHSRPTKQKHHYHYPFPANASVPIRAAVESAASGAVDAVGAQISRSRSQSDARLARIIPPDVDGTSNVQLYATLGREQHRNRRHHHHHSHHHHHNHPDSSDDNASPAAATRAPRPASCHHDAGALDMADYAVPPRPRSVIGTADPATDAPVEAEAKKQICGRSAHDSFSLSQSSPFTHSRSPGSRPPAPIRTVSLKQNWTGAGETGKTGNPSRSELPEAIVDPPAPSAQAASSCSDAESLSGASTSSPTTTSGFGDVGGEGEGVQLRKNISRPPSTRSKTEASSKAFVQNSKLIETRQRQSVEAEVKGRCKDAGLGLHWNPSFTDGGVGGIYCLISRPPASDERADAIQQLASSPPRIHRHHGNIATGEAARDEAQSPSVKELMSRFERGRRKADAEAEADGGSLGR